MHPGYLDIPHFSIACTHSNYAQTAAAVLRSLQPSCQDGSSLKVPVLQCHLLQFLHWCLPLWTGVWCSWACDVTGKWLVAELGHDEVCLWLGCDWGWVSLSLGCDWVWGVPGFRSDRNWGTVGVWAMTELILTVLGYDWASWGGAGRGLRAWRGAKAV